MQGTSESDILQQALVNSGLPGSEKKKDQIVTSIQTMNVRDSATGIVKKHVIRKVSGQSSTLVYGKNTRTHTHTHTDRVYTIFRSTK